MRRAPLAILYVLLVLSSTAHARSESFGRSEQIYPEGNGSIWCNTCNVFVTILTHLLNARDVQLWLIHYFQNHVCGWLPDNIREECIQDAPKFIPAVIKFIGHIAGAHFCSTIHLCGPHTAEMLLEQSKNYTCEAENVCEVCKAFTGAIEEQIEDVEPESVLDSMSKLREACNDVPEDIQEECVDLVNKYGYLLMYFIAKEQSEGRLSKACEDIRICKPETVGGEFPALPVSLVTHFVKIRMSTANAEDGCERCHAIAGRAMQSLTDPEFRNGFEHFITAICGWAPIIKDQCIHALKTVADAFLDGLAKLVNPDGVCDSLGFCGANEIPQEIQLALKQDMIFVEQ